MSEQKETTLADQLTETIDFASQLVKSKTDNDAESLKEIIGIGIIYLGTVRQLIVNNEHIPDFIEEEIINYCNVTMKIT